MNQNALLDWYERHHRDLPFRRQRDAYPVYISEVMAQQTRIEAMLGHYERFMTLFPNLSALAGAPEDQLMKAWQGLGYYSRARSLQKTAKICVEKYDGHLPGTYQELLALPGIGEYTAGAIASIVYGEHVPAIDGNVIRVYARFYGLEDDFSVMKNRKRLRTLVEADLPQGEAMHVWNQALMELGAMICTPKTARCRECPLAAKCSSASRPDPTVLPVKKTKKARRIEEKTVIVAAALFAHGVEDLPAAKVSIRRRPEEGLLAGLYGFDETMPSGVYETMDLGQWRHVFSHVEWHMKGSLVLVDPAQMDEHFRTLDEIEAQCSIPSAFAPFYERAKGRLLQRMEAKKKSLKQGKQKKGGGPNESDEN